MRDEIDNSQQSGSTIYSRIEKSFADGFKQGFECAKLDEESYRAEIERLQSQLNSYQKAELVNRTLFRISELSHDPSLSLKSLYAEVCKELSNIVDTSNFYIARLKDGGKVVSFDFFQDSFDFEYELAHDFPERPFGKGCTELVISRNKTLLLTRFQIQELVMSGQVSERRNFATSWLGSPLAHNNKMLGAIVVQSYQNEFNYSDDDAELFHFVSQHVAAAIVRYEEKIKARIEADSLKQSANFDSLTGLLNRNSILQRLNLLNQRQAKDNSKVAIMFIDLDGFKQINDEHGHSMGDQLLVEVANIMKDIVREDDAICRLGGDEFLIFVKLLSEDAVVSIAERLLDRLKKPIQLNGVSVSIGLSIGIAYCTERPSDYSELIDLADQAMYQAKRSGKHCYKVIESRM